MIPLPDPDEAAPPTGQRLTLGRRIRHVRTESAAVYAQILAPLPTGTFPGVDEAEVYAFLERHAP